MPLYFLFNQGTIVPCRTFPLFSVAFSNPDGQKSIVTAMKQNCDKEQDHSSVCWDFSQVHVVSREVLKVFVSVGDAETRSEDVRVWSGANIVLSVGFLGCFWFFLCTKNNGGAGEGGSQTWDEWHITKKILWSTLGETLAEKSDTWYIIWCIPEGKKCVLGRFCKHLRDKSCLWLRMAWWSWERRENLQMQGNYCEFGIKMQMASVHCRLKLKTHSMLHLFFLFSYALIRLHK